MSFPSRSLSQLWHCMTSAIIVDDVVVGFAMFDLNNTIGDWKDWSVYFLWRCMIGTEYQGNGYGKQTLDLLVQKCKEEGRKYLYVSSTRIDPMPYQMYINYGFEDTGLVDDGESVLRLKIE